MSLLIGALAAWVSLLLAALSLGGALLLRHFRRKPVGPAEPLLAMTLIKPIRGLDEALPEGLESAIEADPEGSLQILLVLETAEDPAYPIARSFAARHPGRDIRVVLSGPSRDRMGKIHNMIEGLKSADRPFVIFSDADARASRALLRRTSQAFREGFEAVFALPFHLPAPGPGGLLLQMAVNHTAGIPAVLTETLGAPQFAAGAWMAYTRRALERVGGLEPFAHRIADDVAISRAVSALGVKTKLLGEYVFIQETGHSVREAFARVSKWAAVARVSLWAWYWACPLLDLGFCALALWALTESTGRGLWMGRGLLGCALLDRGLAGYLQDRFAAGKPMPWPAYFILGFVEAGAILVWLSGLRSTVSWRGKRYRLYRGGRAEVMPNGTSG